ncbi:DNA-binding domain-containing protein [Celeribacter neptunius]|nr:DNA-binding domain-containing protein [Celeribacter neptunius]
MTQQTFITAALTPEQPVPDGLITPDGRPASKRFDVYRNNVVVSLKEALEQGFPAVQSLVGPVFFAAMAGEYLRAHPPKHPVIALYGADFAEFIDNFAPARAIPYLADIARLEYALRQSYHAADSQPVTQSALSDPLLFTRAVRLAPAFAWLPSAYPVTAIHRLATGTCRDGKTVQGGAEDVVITRPAYDPIATAFPAGTGAVLDALASGEALGDAAELAPPRLDLTRFLTTLLSGGAIVAINEI